MGFFGRLPRRLVFSQLLMHKVAHPGVPRMRGLNGLRAQALDVVIATTAKLALRCLVKSSRCNANKASAECDKRPQRQRSICWISTARNRRDDE